VTIDERPQPVQRRSAEGGSRSTTDSSVDVERYEIVDQLPTSLAEREAMTLTDDIKTESSPELLSSPPATDDTDDNDDNDDRETRAQIVSASQLSAELVDLLEQAARTS
jgi:hypothetical protein